MMFDREGVRRDKFSTKPADPAAGKKSYVITGMFEANNYKKYETFYISSDSKL